MVFRLLSTLHKNTSQCFTLCCAKNGQCVLPLIFGLGLLGGIPVPQLSVAVKYRSDFPKVCFHLF